MRTLAFLLCLSVFGVGCSVIYGWHTGDEVLTRIRPWLVSMKYPTALGLLPASLIVWLGFRKERAARDAVLAQGLVLGMVLLTVVLPGLSDIYPEDNEGRAIQTVEPGVPSLGTLIAFSYFAVAGISRAVVGLSRHFFPVVLLAAPTFLGCVALIGYALDRPGLYFYHEGTSTGMAIHTAASFVALGCATTLYLMAEHRERRER